MGRGKNSNNRRRASLDSAPAAQQPVMGNNNYGDIHHHGYHRRHHHHGNQHSSISSSRNNSQYYANCGGHHDHAVPYPKSIANSMAKENNNNDCNNNNNNNNMISNNPQEVKDAIEFHWKNLSMDLKGFLLKNPRELSLRKFVDYWTNPARIENASPNIAASICGCSWYLALNYMSIGAVCEARALILNGCFLQQCYNKPIEEIAAIARTVSGEHFRTHLPFFTDGLLAISSEERMSDFLENKVSSDYRRRMSFATRTTQTKKKVQEYVDQIGSDWNGGAATFSARNKNEARRRRASLDTLPAESFIEIGLVDYFEKKEVVTKMRYGLAMTLKSLFKNYAEDRNLGLRQLRFVYEGRTLFLSSVGSKTPQDLGMKHLDSIMVLNNNNAAAVAAAAMEGPSISQQQQREEETSNSSSDDSKENNPDNKPRTMKSSNKKNRRSSRRASWAGHETTSEEDRLKLSHSRQLSKVFAEVAPRFEQIRQKLNALNLTCAPPKVKRNRRKKPVAIDPLTFVNDNPRTEGTGGKAGVPFYAVHVGAPENLYNTKKNNNKKQSFQNKHKSTSIDLHGLTKEEALTQLNEKLPEWNTIAMRGQYPWVIPVVIICGGGNQILSEAVDAWIKGNDNVAKAPKKKFCRRSTL